MLIIELSKIDENKRVNEITKEIIYDEFGAENH